MQGRGRSGSGGGRHGCLRPQRLAGRGHVRAVPGRPGLGVGVVAGVLRRLPAGRHARWRPWRRSRRRAAPRPGAHPRRAGGRRGRGATPLRGAAGRIVANMEASLGVPTATSVRVVPAKLLEVNRTIVNNQLRRTTGGKVSFTHLIGYAVVKALAAVPAMNAAFVPDADGKGTPGVLRHEHVGLGLAVDVEKVRRPHAAGPVHRRRRHPGLPGASSPPTRTWSARSTPTRSPRTTSPARRSP